MKKTDDLFEHSCVSFPELKNISVEIKYKQVEPHFFPFIDLDDYAKLSRIPGKPFNHANEHIEAMKFNEKIKKDTHRYDNYL